MKIARPALALAATLAFASQAAQITLYKQQNFSGESLPLQQAAHDLARVNFHDQISSIVVTSGMWEVCTQPRFRGDCVVLRPGSYPALDTAINHRIESVREATLFVPSQPSAAPASPPPLEIFASQQFMGPSHAVDRDMHTLAEGGVDTRAASLLVREGTWQACTEPGYQGVCRIFSPGRYRELGGLNQIVSVRRMPADR